MVTQLPILGEKLCRYRLGPLLILLDPSNDADCGQNNVEGRPD